MQLISTGSTSSISLSNNYNNMREGQNQAIESPYKQLKDASSSTVEILKMESQLTRMKKVAAMEGELRKNKEEFNTICKEIEAAEQQLKHKKRQIINDKLMQIQVKQEARLAVNKESNRVLAKIKEEHRERRRRMESLVNQYQKEYDQVYQKRLSQRKPNLRYHTKTNEQQSPEGEHLQSPHKRSNRIKTQSLDKSRAKPRRGNSFFESINIERQCGRLKKEKILQLVNKRNEYGRKAEKQSLRIKIPHQLIAKAKGEISKAGFDKNIDRYALQLNRHKKPKLDTNFSGDIQRNKYQQIKNLITNESPAEDKLTRLRHIVDGFNLQYTYGQTQALDLMCNASLARAKLS